MTLIVDGVFLQLQRPALTRLWQTLLPLVARRLDMPIVLLDRGGRREQIDGIEVVPYPTYKPKFNTHDSALLEKICRHYGAHAFLSTHFTTPLQTPSVLLVCDMIPERLGLTRGARENQEKEVAIAHARRFVCASESTREDLATDFPELDPATIRVAYCGVDPDVFKPGTESAIAAFRSLHGMERPYFLSFEASPHNTAYKNAALLSDAVRTIDEADFDVLCVDASAGTWTSTVMPNGSRIFRTPLDDQDLALAYSGAAAFVCPSIHEGCALTVAEAMACGCPVIATVNGALAEVTQDAALTIGATSPFELAEAMRTVRDPAVREARSNAGLRRAARFRWEPMADALIRAVQETALEHRSGLHWNFYDTWARLRSIQGEVDIVF